MGPLGTTRTRVSGHGLSARITTQLLFPAAAPQQADVSPASPPAPTAPVRMESIGTQRLQRPSRSTVRSPVNVARRPRPTAPAAGIHCRTTGSMPIRTVDPAPAAHRDRHSMPRTGPGSARPPQSRPPAGWAHRAGWTPPRRMARSLRAAIHEPSRTSMSTPATAALPRVECTACGQISKAVTLAQPMSAAAIATNPLPVQRSRTRRPETTPLCCIARTSNRESCCG